MKNLKNGGSDILKKYANEEKPLLNKHLHRTEIYC